MYEDIEKMYLLYYGELYRFVLKLGGDQNLADDIVQATFLEALKSIERFDGKSSLKTWLFAIAKNQLYAHFRKNKKTLRTEAQPESVYTDYTDKMLADDIVQFFDSLTPPLNELMKLRLLYGLSFKEIGLKIGKTENYCRVNFYRLKERLRKEFHYE